MHVGRLADRLGRPIGHITNDIGGLADGLGRTIGHTTDHTGGLVHSARDGIGDRAEQARRIRRFLLLVVGVGAGQGLQKAVDAGQRLGDLAPVHARPDRIGHRLERRGLGIAAVIHLHDLRHAGLELGGSFLPFGQRRGGLLGRARGARLQCLRGTEHTVDVGLGLGRVGRVHLAQGALELRDQLLPQAIHGLMLCRLCAGLHRLQALVDRRDRRLEFLAESRPLLARTGVAGLWRLGVGDTPLRLQATARVLPFCFAHPCPFAHGTQRPGNSGPPPTGSGKVTKPHLHDRASMPTVHGGVQANCAWPTPMPSLAAKPCRCPRGSAVRDHQNAQRTLRKSAVCA
ncbi:MAG: hypothetical protein IPP87_11905 [Ideonella sp.]|nr:hypothetical protein [Ideonella sp.]